LGDKINKASFVQFDNDLRPLVLKVQCFTKKYSCIKCNDYIAGIYGFT